MRNKKKKTRRKNKKALRVSKKKKLLAFLLGSVFVLFLVYWFYNILTKLDIQIQHVLMLSVPLFAFLVICIYCSKSFRCLFFLLLPQVFSWRGRSTIIAYAFILTLSGPMKNFVVNLGELSNSLLCSQEQMKNFFKDQLEVLKAPLLVIAEIIKSAATSIQDIFIEIKRVVELMEESVGKIISAIRKAYKWLEGLFEICNEKYGRPFDKCMEAFESNFQACKDNLGLLSAICQFEHLASQICYSIKFIDYICDFTIDVPEMFDGIEERLKMFRRDIVNMFYVSIKIDHKFDFHSNETKTFDEIANEILEDIKHRSELVLKFFHMTSFISTLFFIFLVYKTVNYKRKYLSDYQYDNLYITSKFHEINERRLKANKDAVLPLTRKERNKFIEITSIKLIKVERHKIFKSGFFAFLSSMYILFVILADYSFSWFLALVSYYESTEINAQKEFDMMAVNVTGEGFVFELCRNMVETSARIIKSDIDLSACLPHPSVPNYGNYRNISLLLAVAWVSIFFEPYGLRMRHLVMSHHYPQQTMERTVWLYSHILKKRSNFLKVARRKMRTKFLKDATRNHEDEFGCMEIFRAKISDICILRKLFGTNKVRACMLCGLTYEKYDEYMKCQRPGCNGIYCSECYHELDNTCSLCMEPMEYGDFSDVSEEVDSSDQERGKQIFSV